jgi:hypothetical protein
MAGIKLAIFEYGATSGRAKWWCKSTAGLNVLPPICKRKKFYEAALEVSENTSKVTPGAESAAKTI